MGGGTSKACANKRMLKECGGRTAAGGRCCGNVVVLNLFKSNKVQKFSSMIVVG